jgi:hypothetical protein
MRAKLDTFVSEALPEWSPVIAHEVTDYGWRGLTSNGEVLEVKGDNISVPEEIVVARAGRPVARRAVSNVTNVDIDRYLVNFNRAVELYKQDRLDEALAVCEMIDPLTLRAKHNRSMMLLAAGRWRHGLREYWECEQSEPFIRPQAKAALDLGILPWMGEDLSGKKLALIHAHGFGDTIMMLRYVPRVRLTGADVVLVMPEELLRLASQHGEVVSEIPRDADAFCPMLHLLYLLDVHPDDVVGRSYLRSSTAHLSSSRKKVGLAWSIGKPSDGDFPRQIPLEQLVDHFKDCELHSVQIQGAEEAKALGVKTHDFIDFADCAAVMSSMDEIVSVDTAALHLAGAIGHPEVYGLLSRWASWRWVAPWYDNVKLCRQTSDGDWASALTQI